MKSSPGKRLLSKVIYDSRGNALMRAVLKPVASTLPDKFIHRLPIVGTVIVPSPWGKILFRGVGLDDLLSTVFWHGLDAFEGETLHVFFELLRTAQTFLDVGANIGLYTLLAGLAAHRPLIYAFEPDPSVFDRLKTNIALNGLINAHAVPCAVTDHDGEVDLHLLPGASASTDANAKRFTSSISVPALTLDTFAADQDLQRIDLLKLDTEMTEPVVLSGARRIIARDKPASICEVLAGCTELALNALLTGTGYRYFWISPEGLDERAVIEGDPTYRCLNYLFIAEDRLQALLRNSRLAIRSGSQDE